MLIRKTTSRDVAPSEITPERVYVQRRQILRTALAAAPALLVGCDEEIATPPANAGTPKPVAPGRYANAAKSAYSTDEQLSSFRDVTTYNNFYEFGLAKDAPARNARLFKTNPWKVTISGHAEETGTFDLDDLVGKMRIEERIYRMRCVEGWSMVIPWVGFALGDLLKRFKPTSQAKFVAFKTLHDPSQMPGQNSGVLDWPYREGLRIDEAMHPLTILAVGLYGREMPNQNGAPLRLVVPWKYGFKGIKSIVEIAFVEAQPETSWNQATPNEYGFYSNVNPSVAHPRWSQATERRIAEGTSLFAQRIKARLFNGYDEVAPLYAGMDPKKFY